MRPGHHPGRQFGGDHGEPCGNFVYDRTEAALHIESAQEKVATGWPEEQAACGLPPDTLPPPSFEWLAGKS